METTQLNLQDIGDFLSKLAEKSENVYWLSSPDFETIQYISPAYEKIWGRSVETLYKEPELWITYLHPDDAKDHHPIHAMKDRVAKLGPDARYEENYRIIRPNGEIRWIVDRGFPIYDSGVCCGVTGVAIDITTEMEVEQLRKERAIAEETNKHLKTMAGSIAHELRNPLGGIKTAVSFIKATTQKLVKQFQQAKPDVAALEIPKFSEKVAKQCAKITRDSNRGLKYIDMQLANIKSGSKVDTSAFTQCSMTQIVEAALALVSHFARIWSMLRAVRYTVVPGKVNTHNLPCASLRKSNCITTYTPLCQDRCRLH